jgi:hypothetical protein
MLNLSHNHHVTTVSPREPQWKYASSIYLPRHHCVIFRDDELGVQKQVMTRRNTFIFPAREREYYFVDGDRRTYRSEDHLLKALLRIHNRRNGDGRI